MVTSAVTNPPKIPPIIQGVTASGVSECAKPHVHAAVATTHSSSKPVLLTVPCRVIASPPRVTSLRNAFSLRAGLDVRNGALRDGSAMFGFLVVTHPVYARRNRVANRTRTSWKGRSAETDNETF